MRHRLAALLSASVCFIAAPVAAVEIVLTVSEARVPDETEEPGGAVVYLKFDPDSARALDDFTAEHIGEMASFRIGNRVVYSAWLSSRVPTGSIAIMVGDKEGRDKDAATLVEQLSASPTLTLVAPAPVGP